jgi:acyl-CoA synthetase (AMP-forming)/AMP-acid ligase II
VPRAERREGADVSLGELVTRSARFWGDSRVAVIDADREATFGDLDRRSNQFAGLLSSLGVEPGDRVALLVGNRLEWYDATLGCLKAGVVRTFINPRHTPPEIAYQVEDSGAKVVIVSDDYAPLIEGSKFSDVREVVEIGPGYERLLARQDVGRPTVDVPDDHPAEIRYTSGTTGRPKGAVHSHGSWRSLTIGSMYYFGLRDDDVLLHVGPMSHASGGFALPVIATGARQVIHRGFDPIEVAEAIPRYGVTTILLVPTMIYMLLDLMAERAIDTSTLRTILYGAAPMSPNRLERCLEIVGPVFLQGYGMSEVLGGMTFLLKEEHLPGDPRLSSCGRPSLLGELIVADAEGREVPAGEEGEILMRGPTRMTEYWNRPEATASALTADGWFRSGDIARMDEQGYVYIVDRKADMIVSGGFNVYPVEVEHALMVHDDVLEVAVVAVPDDKWGEAVKAVVRLRPGRTVSEDELLGLVRSQLAGYKIPKSVDFVDSELPKNPTGKLLRRLVREPYWQSESRRVG